MVQGDSKEAVAYALLLGLPTAQGKIKYIGNSTIGQNVVTADEDWVLNTYAKCLRIVSGVTPNKAKEFISD